MNKACFLDRDGVINEEVNYLHEADKVVLIPGIAEGINRAHDAGYLVIVITNQAGVARGIFPEGDILLVHREIERQLALAGAKIDRFYYCPHHPDYTGECKCRKPSPGMILQAASDFDIDLKSSFMIGDRPSDVRAGENAGLAASYLVETGYGKEVVSRGEASGFTVMATPLDAINDFISRGQ